MTFVWRESISIRVGKTGIHERRRDDRSALFDSVRTGAIHSIKRDLGTRELVDCDHGFHASADGTTTNWPFTSAIRCPLGLTSTAVARSPLARR